MSGQGVSNGHVASLIALGMMTIVPMPAQAAGGDAAPLVIGVLWLSLFLVLAVPAMGFGFVLGSFLTPKVSIAVIVFLTLVPTALAWMSRGIDLVVDSAPLQLVMFLMFSPLATLGWRLGWRDTKRQMARSQAAYENGK